MVATEPWVKYITWDWQKIKPHDFPDTRVDYFDKIIKFTGSIQCAIAIHRTLLSYLFKTF